MKQSSETSKMAQWQTKTGGYVGFAGDYDANNSLLAKISEFTSDLL